MGLLLAEAMENSDGIAPLERSDCHVQNASYYQTELGSRRGAAAMANNRKLPLLGALIATPAFTASFEPAAAYEVKPASIAAPGPTTTEAARTALKSALLAIRPTEKLAIAGERLGLDPTLSLANEQAGISHNKVSARTCAAVAMCAASLQAHARTVKNGGGHHHRHTHYLHCHTAPTVNPGAPHITKANKTY
ncbi:MAG: hypothetical protein ACHP7N_07500 [Caulobacterales bacterium]